MSGADTAGSGDPLGRRTRQSPTVWLVRIVTLAMLVAAVVTLWRRHRDEPAQEELVRYATLTVPGYLEDLERLHALLDRLQVPGVTPAAARAVLVDELMPWIIRMRRRAEAVTVAAAPVRASNAEYLGALDRYMDMDRAAVRAIDDPGQPGADGQQAFLARRREADEAVRQFLGGLRTRCEQAGLKLVPAGGAPGTAR